MCSGPARFPDLILSLTFPLPPYVLRLAYGLIRPRPVIYTHLNDLPKVTQARLYLIIIDDCLAGSQ